MCLGEKIYLLLKKQLPKFIWNSAKHRIERALSFLWASMRLFNKKRTLQLDMTQKWAFINLLISTKWGGVSVTDKLKSNYSDVIMGMDINSCQKNVAFICSSGLVGLTDCTT